MDSNKSPSLLQSLYDIASSDTDKVYNSIPNLMKVLQTNQKNFEEVSQKVGALPIGTTNNSSLSTVSTTLVASSGKSSSSSSTVSSTSTTPGTTVSTYCNDIHYTLKRFVRGLNSTNARIHFTIALIELLITFPGLSTDEVLQQLYTETRAAGLTGKDNGNTKDSKNTNDIKGGTSKNEIREALLGRLFGIVALYKAGRLDHNGSNDTIITGTNGSMDMYSSLLGKVINELFLISNKRSWLHPVSWEIIASLFPSTPASSAVTASATGTGGTITHNVTAIVTYNLWQRSLGKVIEAQYINRSSAGTNNTSNQKHSGSAATVVLPVNEWSAEHLALALAIDNAFVQWGAGYNVMDNTNGNNKIIVPEFLRKLRTVLALSTTTNATTTHPFTHAAIDSVTTYPAVHPMWRRLFERCTASSGSIKKSIPIHTEELSTYWSALVDTTLLHNTKDRRAMAVQIFTLAVTMVGQHPDALTILLTPGILQLFISELPDKKRLLHGTTKEALTTVVENCRKYPSTAIIVLKAILQQGYTNFDSSTHTQTISTLLTLIEPQEVLQYVVYLLQVFHNPRNYVRMIDDESGSSNSTKSHDISMDEIGVDISVADIARTSRMTIDNDDTNDDNLTNDEAKITNIDRIRLNIVMSLSYAIRNPTLSILRDMKIIKPLLAYLAYHAFISTEGTTNNPLPKDSTTSFANEFGWNSLVEPTPLLPSSSNGSNASIHNLATLFYTVPSIQDNARNELRTRLNTLIKEIVHVQVTENRSTTNTPDETTTNPTNHKERSIQTTSLSFSLLEIMNNVYDKLVQLSSTVTTLSIHPSPSLLTEKGEDDRHVSDDDEDDNDSDDDGDHEHESSVVAPMEARRLALTTAQNLHTITTNLGSFVTAQKMIDTSLLSRIRDSSRQCSAYSSLLEQVALAILFDSKTMHELTNATVDLLVCCRGLLSSTFSTIYELNTLFGTKTTTSSTGKKDKPQSKPNDSNDNGKYVQTLTNTVCSIQETIAVVIARTNTDDEDDGDEETSGGTENDKSKRQYNQDMSVFIDALLALLANANASLRETVKTAARPVLMDVTASALEPIVELLASDLSGNGKENGNDGEDDDEGSNKLGDDDEESVTLSMGSDDELSTLLGVTGSNKKTKNKKRKRPTKQDKDSDEDEDDDDESSSEDEANDDSVPPEVRRAAALAEMEQYDRMLSHMLKLRKEARGNAKEARVRGLHFRFRALDLLDLAVSNLVTTSTYSTSSTLLQGYGSPEGIKLLQLLFNCATKLASRIRSKESTGHTADAEDINTLLQRVIAIMGRLTKTKVPAIVDTNSSSSSLTMNDDSSLSVVQIYRAANISTEFVTEFLATVVRTVHSARSTMLMEISTSITGCLIRLLRPITASSSTDNSNNTNTVTHAQNMQPSITVLPFLVTLFTDHLESYLKDKHPRVSLSFYKNVFTALPVIAVHCLQPFASSVINGSISKPFRITETLQTITSIVKLCTSTVNGSLVCEQSTTNSTTKEKKSKKNNSSNTTVTAPNATNSTVTVTDKLASYVPLINQALTLIIQRSVEVHHPTATTLSSTSSSSSDTPVTLHPKQLREPLELVRLLLKQELLTGTSAKDLFSSVRNLYAVTTIDYIKKLSQTILETVNIDLPEDNDDDKNMVLSSSSSASNSNVTNGSNEPSVGNSKPSKAKKSKVTTSN